MSVLLDGVQTVHQLHGLVRPPVKGGVDLFSSPNSELEVCLMNIITLLLGVYGLVHVKLDTVHRGWDVLLRRRYWCFHRRSFLC